MWRLGSLLRRLAPHALRLVTVVAVRRGRLKMRIGEVCMSSVEAGQGRLEHFEEIG